MLNKRNLLVCLFASWCLCFLSYSQYAAPVEYTEVRAFAVERELRLSGTVVAKTSANVAVEVAGLVTEVMVREGTPVDAGQPLLRLDVARIDLQIRGAEGELQETAARLKLAETNLKRVTNLHGQNVLSASELEIAKTEVDSRHGSLQRLKAQIAQYKLDRERSVLRAPFAGTVVGKRAEKGEWLLAGSAVIDLIAMDELEVDVEVPERFYTELRVGSHTEIRFESLPGLVHEGAISLISPRATGSRTIPVRVGFQNEGNRVPAGILADVVFDTKQNRRTTIVPKDAIVPQGSAKQVFVLGKDNTVVPVSVRIGVGFGHWVEVFGKVEPGQKVVTLGNERLQPGQLVAAREREYQLP